MNVILWGALWLWTWSYFPNTTVTKNVQGFCIDNIKAAPQQSCYFPYHVLDFKSHKNHTVYVQSLYLWALRVLTMVRIPPSPPEKKARRYSKNAVFTGFSYALQLQFRQFKMQVWSPKITQNHTKYHTRSWQMKGFFQNTNCTTYTWQPIYNQLF